jgi:hypothetical protein
LFFEEIEASREVGEYIAPVLARAIEQQIQFFEQEQKDVYDRIKSRQYFKATNFLALTRAKKNVELEKLADDIVGMIDRLRQLPVTSSPDYA